MKARVLKAGGTWNVVQTSVGEIVKTRLKGKLRLQNFESNNPIAVGDWVELSREKDDWLIKFIYERENSIERQSTKIGKQVQILAANIDQVVIIMSLKNPKSSLGFLDRILVSAESSQVKACILFNKIDLLSKNEIEQAYCCEEAYQKLGYTCRLISLKEKNGIIEISKIVRGKLSLLIGNSGVGKSTLVNSLDERKNRLVGKISEANSKGKHTTTLAELLFLENNNTMIIDAPGIKEFGLYSIKPDKLRWTFPEFWPYQKKCKFSDCMHKNEPHCEVKLAVAEKKIQLRRYNYYLELLNELQ